MALINSLKFNAVAPGFKLVNEKGGYFNLVSQFANNRYVVLFFYPKTLGNGDVMEFLYFKETFENFNDLNAVVVGLVPSSSEINKNFKKRFDLPFSILHDELGLVRKLYGNRYYFISTRLTVVIDRHQKILHQYESFISSKNHVKKSLRILSDISNYKHSHVFNQG